MKDKLIITSGKKYIDIDAYAGMILYKILLEDLGYEVYTTTTAVLNESIPEFIIDLPYKIDNVYFDSQVKYIVLDVSNPDFFDTFVEEDRIVEIIDHHVGYEEYWKNKGVKAEISFIGSICTIIFERFQMLEKTGLLNQNLCKLLIAGILDNTLNLKSRITSKRDIDAYQSLLEIGGLDKSFSNEYFLACYSDVVDKLEQYLINDIKVEKVSSLLPEVIGQLIVLESKDIFQNIDRVHGVFDSFGEWILNVISLADGKSYIFCSNNTIAKDVMALLGGEVYKQVVILDNCILRKEIIKTAIEQEREKKDGNNKKLY